MKSFESVYPSLKRYFCRTGCNPYRWNDKDWDKWARKESSVPKSSYVKKVLGIDEMSLAYRADYEQLDLEAFNSNGGLFAFLEHQKKPDLSDYPANIPEDTVHSVYNENPSRSKKTYCGKSSVRRVERVKNLQAFVERQLGSRDFAVETFVDYTGDSRQARNLIRAYGNWRNVLESYLKEAERKKNFRIVYPLYVYLLTSAPADRPYVSSRSEYIIPAKKMPRDFFFAVDGKPKKTVTPRSHWYDAGLDEIKKKIEEFNLSCESKNIKPTFRVFRSWSRENDGPPLAFINKIELSWNEILEKSLHRPINNKAIIWSKESVLSRVYEYAQSCLASGWPFNIGHYKESASAFDRRPSESIIYRRYGSWPDLYLAMFDEAVKRDDEPMIEFLAANRPRTRRKDISSALSSHSGLAKPTPCPPLKSPS